MQKITPCLWFDHQAEEAVAHYLSIFKEARIVSVARYGEAGAAAAGMPEGMVMVIVFRIEGQEIMALNGGPAFTFSPALSLVVNCESQEEVDVLWEKLSGGGEPGPCGWLKDKFGVSWQIVPAVLGTMLQDQDPARTERVMRAMLQMTKIDLAGLQRAYGL